MATVQQKKKKEGHGEHVSTPSSLSTLVAALKERKVARLEPTFHPKIGFTYAELENTGFESQMEDLALLERTGLISSMNSITTLRCPDCKSYALSCKLACQACASSDMVKGSVIEHISCGNVDFEEKYHSDSGKLVCKKCSKRLNAIGVDYSRPGYFYKCMSCNVLLPTVSEQYFCMGCGRKSERKELAILRMPIYVVDLEKLSEFSAGSDDFVNALTKDLELAGVRVIQDSTLKGASQVSQEFSLIVCNSDGVPLFVCDRADKYQSAETAILSIFAKGIDVRIKQLGILTEERLEEKAASLASAYGITIMTINQEDLKSSVSSAVDAVVTIVKKQKSVTGIPVKIAGSEA